MKKIVLERTPPQQEILFCDISESDPIFAMRDDKLRGMLICEVGKGWVLKVSGMERIDGATGHYSTVRECIESCLLQEYEFYVE